MNPETQDGRGAFRDYLLSRKAQISREIAQQWEALRDQPERMQDKVMLAWVIEARVLDELLYRLDHGVAKAS